VAAQIAVGKRQVEFGGYTWRVLNVEENTALSITESISDVRPYHDEYIQTTWEMSTLREYLNGSFYNTFSAGDKDQILTTHLVNASSTIHGYPGGKDTEDNVFLLSVDEANKYFGSDEDRLARIPVQVLGKLVQVLQQDYGYAGNEVVRFLAGLNDIDNVLVWWLRSPSDEGYDGKSVVSTKGYAGEDRTVNIGYVGVRPALTINLKP
jgi:hypothetical protein